VRVSLDLPDRATTVEDQTTQAAVAVRVRLEALMAMVTAAMA
tara:strand:- start:839 stop:964 length:126 start_codon:yes stop_codon:yes gene_type:complete